ncbi:MAG TPA: fatty acid--CoA ligase family protein [Rhizomicrobium sp.]
MPRAETLRGALGAGSTRLFGAKHSIAFADIANSSVLENDLAGRNVLLRTADQFAAALALIELDGVAKRLVIAPPDLDEAHLPAILERAEIDTIVSDMDMPGHKVEYIVAPRTRTKLAAGPVKTKWVLFTSGTTGIPKMVAHDFSGLTGAIKPDATPDIVWGTFYDIRRYGGLQIFLRAILGNASLILSDASEETGDFLARLGGHGVTHLTGTPSHWRRALMSPALAKIAPRYLRLSGEIADQAILDSLKAAFPGATIGHAYASTEAGVGFEVTDGLEGFPASLIGASDAVERGAVEMKIEDGTLHIRSPRAASHYVGSAENLEKRGFVDTGDLIDQRGDRCYFAGRKTGVINVGGLKIHPEEVEAVINRHPAVRASRVSGRKSPITGAIVVADVLRADAAIDDVALKKAILAACRENLAAVKVPANLRFVDALALTAGGKLARHG